MGYKLDHVFDSDGTELSSPTHATTLDGAVSMAYDGRYLWVTCGTNGVAIYEWWGEASDHEPAFETLDDLMYPRYDDGPKKKLRLVTYITVSPGSVTRSTVFPSLKEEDAVLHDEKIWVKTSIHSGGQLNAFYIKKCAGKMYVTNGPSFKQIFAFDIQAQNLIEVIGVSDKYAGNEFPMNSNLESAGGKLWMVGSTFSDISPQKLYSLNPITKAMTTTAINVRPSLARTAIANGFNGSVYITDYNNVSVNRYNVETAAFIQTIRVNAFPTNIFSGPDRRIWVSSYAGMVSLIDWNDSEVHNDWSSGLDDPMMRAISLQVDTSDGSKLWFVNSDNVLVRHDINTHEQLETAKPENTPLSAGSSFPLPDGQTVMIQNTAEATAKVLDPLGNIHVLSTGESINVTGSDAEQLSVEVLAGSIDVKPSGDWVFEHTKLGKPEQLWISLPATYQDETQAVRQVKPYVFIIQEGKLLSWRLDRYLYRDNYATVNGQGAVVAGPQHYFGE